MKSKIYKTIVFLFLIGVACSQNKKSETKIHNTTQQIQNGDIIFHISLSDQSKAIQLATKSPYSHMGIIYESEGKFWVYEAAKTVQLTSLEKWIKRGKNKHYVVKRLRNSDEHLTLDKQKKLKIAGEKYKGKPYDLYFKWSDDKIYCSELVWKMYKEALGIEIGKLKKLGSFDLTNQLVKQKIKERYGNQIPLDEKVISPSSMFNSELLITVVEE